MSGYPRQGGGSPSSAAQKALPSKQQKKPPLRADFLLNFQRPPSHQRPQVQTQPRRSRPSGHQRAPVAFTKGRFVQSSFRLFVEALTPDVVEAAFSADTLLDWSSIRRVDLLCEEHPKCPICLEEDMVVPKITRCGHVFCAPCVMRYFLLLQDYNSKIYQRCPVCNEQVTPKDLVSVRLQMTRPLREGDRVSFVLAHRGVDSTLVWLSQKAYAAAAAAALGEGQEGQAEEGGVSNVSSSRGSAGAEEALRLPTQLDPGWYLGRVACLGPGEADLLLALELEALRQYRPAAIAAGDTELLPSIDAAVELLHTRRCEQGEQRAQDAVGSPASSPALAPEALSAAALPGDLVPADAPSWTCRYVEVPRIRAVADTLGGTSTASSSLLGMAPAGASTDDGGVEGLDNLSLLPASATADLGESDRECDDAEDGRCEDGRGEVGDVVTTASRLELGAFSPGQGSLASPAISATATTPLSRPAPSPTIPGGGRIITFYQGEDGRLVYLQPFFTKLLLYEHGHRWDQLPAVLPDLRLERIQELTINEETRRRHRFLGHLPLGSQVSFVEVDLRHFLSKETREHFAEDFQRRRQQRKKDQMKSRKEERLSKSRAAEEEEKYYKSLNLTHPSAFVMQQPPTADDFVPLPGRADAEGAPGPGDEGDGGAGGVEGGAEPGGDDEEESGPTLADKIKERLAAKTRATKAKAPLREAFRGDDAYFPELGAADGGGAGASRSANAAEQSPAPASAGAPAPAGARSAWGRGRGADRAAGAGASKGGAGEASTGAAAASAARDPLDEQPSFGQALEAALRSATQATGSGVGTSGAAGSDNAAAGQDDNDVADGGVAGGSGGKKKKGRAGKATTIRLFG